MVDLTRHGEVTRVRLWTRRSAAAGYDVSAYVIHGVLVDTGFRRARAGLEHALEALRPRGAIVTHWHEDHAGNAPTLAAGGMPMWMPAWTERQLRRRPQVKLYRHVIWGRPRALEATLRPLDAAPLQVIHTPGHSEDHHVVFDPRTGTLVSGDLWLGVKVRMLGYSEDPMETARSLDRVIALQPERMFDAHRGLVERPLPQLAAKRDWLLETSQAIEALLRRDMSEGEIVKRVLGHEHVSDFFTQREYSPRNWVRAVRRSRGL